jgi:hypothetical protein
MSGRRIRRLVLLALVVGVGYWVYKDRPTATGLIDDITNPLMGSKAAVKTSERNRAVGDASSVISEQTDVKVGTLHEGMTTAEVRDLLGAPERVEKDETRGAGGSRWIYASLKRVLVFEDGRVVSIVID